MALYINGIDLAIDRVHIIEETSDSILFPHTLLLIILGVYKDFKLDS